MCKQMQQVSLNISAFEYRKTPEKAKGGFLKKYFERRWLLEAVWLDYEN